EVFKFSKLRLGEQANNSLRVAFVSSATGRAGYASRQRRFYQGTTTSSCEAAAERRRSRPCWRARASGARRLARVPRSAERAVAPQAGCVREAAPPPHPASLDPRCLPPRRRRVCRRTHGAPGVGAVL